MSMVGVKGAVKERGELLDNFLLDLERVSYGP